MAFSPLSLLLLLFCVISITVTGDGRRRRKKERGGTTTKEEEKEGLELIRLDKRERKGWGRVRNSPNLQYTACYTSQLGKRAQCLRMDALYFFCILFGDFCPQAFSIPYFQTRGEGKDDRREWTREKVEGKPGEDGRMPFMCRLLH